MPMLTITLPDLQETFVLPEQGEPLCHKTVPCWLWASKARGPPSMSGMAVGRDEFQIHTSRDQGCRSVSTDQS
ncbi:hypothetical protein J6590_101759 [Homalodisca vitripennis]|nr:hypothetical protein J6590_101759 [Homalodisca vitripennis]